MEQMRDILKSVRRTEGFGVEHAEGNSVRAWREGGKHCSFRADDGGSRVRTALVRLEQIGWTPALYEAQVQREREMRMKEAERRPVRQPVMGSVATPFGAPTAAPALPSTATLALPGGGSITIGFETVDRATAGEWMELVPVADKAAGRLGQRPRRRTLVEEYGSIMDNGDWGLSPDSIVFNDDGELINGQHRVEAVNQTGKSQSFLVIRGWPRQGILIMDKGGKRSPRDTLAVEGESNANYLSGLLMLLVKLDTTDQVARMKGLRPTEGEQHRALARMPEARIVANLTGEVRPSRFKINGPAWGAALLHSTRVSQANEFEAVVEWWRHFAMGLSADHPAWAIRDFLIGDFGQRKRLSRPLAMADRTASSLWYMATAWNLTMRGEKGHKIPPFVAAARIPEFDPFNPAV